jgi:hypothetical protein
MAIWQISVELLPLEWVESQNNPIEFLYNEDGYDTSPSWINNQPSIDYKELFSDILPVADSWDEDLELWGATKVHDISVWFDEGGIFSIGFRLDLREDIQSIALNLISVANKMNCCLFDPSQKIIYKADLPSFLKVAQNSNASKFSNDPHSLFEELATKHNKKINKD